MHGNIGEDDRLAHRFCFLNGRAPAFEFRGVDHRGGVPHQAHEIAERHSTERTKGVENVKLPCLLHERPEMIGLAVIRRIACRQDRHRIPFSFQQSQRL